MRLLIADAGSETGKLLQGYLNDRGASRDSRATVCYGLSSNDRCNLNGKCGGDKIDRMQIMTRSGVRMIPWFTGNSVPQGITFPLLARKRLGRGGKDIMPVFQPEEIPWRMAAGWHWFSQYVPVAAELRVFVFRDQVLDTFQKNMRRPSSYERMGRNFDNGFDFEKTSNQRDATEEAIKAIKSLGLDFAAVDMLRGKDGHIYILEVNTAPGVLKSGAQATIGKLADCIINWEKQGYPKW